MGDRDHMSHEEFVNLQRQRAIALARSILDGEIGPVEGSRYMVRFRGTLDLGYEQEYELLSLFIGLDSVTDDLPIGPERNSWAPEALQEVDARIAAYEDDHREAAFSDCRRLIDVLEPLIPEKVEELDMIETLEEVRDGGSIIPKGSVGTVVMVYTRPNLAYEVEFANDQGRTLALVTLLPGQVRVIRRAPSQEARRPNKGG